MVASDGLAEFLRDQLAPLGRVTMQRMLGKTGVFCDGLMPGMVTDDTLDFRVDDHNRAVFREVERLPPLNYQKKGSTIDFAFLARARAVVRRARRVCRMGGRGACGGAPGCGEMAAGGANAKIKAAVKAGERSPGLAKSRWDRQIRDGRNRGRNRANERPNDRCG